MDRSMQCFEARTGRAVAMLALLAAAGVAAQPSFDGQNPSPLAGGTVSREVNAAADRAGYRPVAYANAGRPGATLIVLAGEVRASDAQLRRQVRPQNIADWAELELARANFRVIERAALGAVQDEVERAYELGSPQDVQRVRRGQVKSARWLVKLDLIKAEPIASSSRNVDGRPLGQLAGLLGQFAGSNRAQRAGAVGETVAGSVSSEQSASVWLLGLRYRVIDAETTEQVGQGYVEEKMESGATASAVMGVGSAREGGVGFDTMAQRLVQRAVWEIDGRFK